MSKIRAEITKGEELRYISHLDYASAIERAVRRSKLPVAFSEGFNPHMKISFASAMSLGVTSDVEYIDIEFKTDITVEKVLEKLKVQLPPGIIMKQVKLLEGKHQALMAAISLAEYTVKIPFTGDVGKVEQALRAYNAADTVIYIRRSPKKPPKEIEIKQYMQLPIQAQCIDNMLLLNMAIKITPTGSIKPSEVLKVLVENYAMPVKQAEAFINRTNIYAGDKKPMEV